MAKDVLFIRMDKELLNKVKIANITESKGNMTEYITFLIIDDLKRRGYL